MSGQVPAMERKRLRPRTDERLYQEATRCFLALIDERASRSCLIPTEPQRNIRIDG